MHEIKEELRESKKLQEMIEFIEDFEHGSPDEFVKRGEFIKIMTAYWEASNKRFRLENGK